MTPAKIHIGTSGWMYKDWHHAFYPAEVPKKKLLCYYAEHFSTVEINATFYRLPTENAVQGWHDKVPENFVFAVKGSRLITHNKRLKNAEDAVAGFIERIRPLAEHLGCILWQLPPSFKKDIEILESFCTLLPRDIRHAIEFRHPSWIDDETMATLRRHNIAVVWISSTAMPMNFAVTADFIYLRFHGLQQGYQHNYTRDELAVWAERLVEQAGQKRPAFVYFNNDGYARAPENAKLLKEMVKQP
jgi:uncharacterized protein YecE (DUF72 family)